MRNIFIFGAIIFAGNLFAQAPDSGPNAPTAAAGDVVSIFSDAYTNVETKPWNPNWGQTTKLELKSIGGNEVAEYTSLNFTGIEPTATIDLTNYTYFNVSYWTEITNFKIKLVDFGTDGAWSGGDDTEDELSYTPVSGEWNYLKVNIDDFAKMTARNHFAQLIFSTSDAGATVYVDDIYFSKADATSISSINLNVSLNVFPNPVDKLLNVSYKQMTKIAITNISGQMIFEQQFLPTEMKTINLLDLPNGLYLITVESELGITTTKFIKQ